MKTVEQKIRNAFTEHRARAASRGLLFTLTFEQWWELWAPFWHLRGRKVGQMVMCRTRDEGGYEIGNVRIDTVTANGHERAVAHRVKKAPTAYRLSKRFQSHGLLTDWMPSRENNPLGKYDLTESD